MVVLSLICIAFGIGYATLPTSLHRQEARATSQTTQAAVAWAQIGVLWRGGVGEVAYDGTGLAVTDGKPSSKWGGDLSGLAGKVEASANIARWNTGGGFIVRFVDPFAAPESGGSLFFEATSGTYRVTIRPESGLTTRQWADQ